MVFNSLNNLSIFFARLRIKYFFNLNLSMTLVDFGILIALITAGIAVIKAWLVWKQHRLDEAERIKKLTTSLGTASAITTPTFPTTYSPPTVPSAGVVLASEVGADYTRLQDLLVAQKYREADQETTHIMLWITGREKESWLDLESINKFPYSDLRTIDQLWVQKSNGRFGFSIQKEIYNQLGKDFGRLANQVEWTVGGKWKSHEQLMFEMTAPKGHLPFCGGCGVNSLLLRQDL